MQDVDKYHESINIIIHENDKGQSDAINKGFKLAIGELAGWINSDDVLYPFCVERIVSLYNRHKEDGVIFCFSLIDLINSDGNVMYTVEKKFIDKNSLIHKDRAVIQQGSFYPVQNIKAIRYLNEELQNCMDPNLWRRLLNFGKICTIDDAPGASFRIWTGGKTSTSAKDFSNAIIKILIQNNAGKFSKRIMKNRWHIFKNEIKNYLNGIQVMEKENK